VIRPRWPGGLRRRLVLTLVLVAAVSAGTLAVASYLLVQQARFSALLVVGQAETTDDLRLADGVTPTRDTLDPNRFVRSYQSLRGTPAVLVFPGHRPVASDSLVDPPIPAPLRRTVDSGRLGYQMIRIGGSSYLMTGGRVPQSPARLYVFFPAVQTGQELSQLRNALAAGWLAGRSAAGRAGRPDAGQAHPGACRPRQSSSHADCWRAAGHPAAGRGAR
jgi:hypothetical protein